MKSYAVQVTEANIPKPGQDEDPEISFPPQTNVMRILRYKDNKKKIRWIKALKKELNTVIDSGTLNNKEQAIKNYTVVSTTDANKIKLDQDDNMEELKLQRCVRGDLQKKKNPTMEDPPSPSTSMIMSKLLLSESARHKAIIFQLDVIGAFLQAILRSSRVFITLPKVYCEGVKCSHNSWNTAANQHS
jgi:chromatin segregation and condensation protein Rec8/ScpA/Scc1 (kleisin family)